MKRADVLEIVKTMLEAAGYEPDRHQWREAYEGWILKGSDEGWISGVRVEVWPKPYIRSDHVEVRLPEQARDARLSLLRGRRVPSGVSLEVEESGMWVSMFIKVDD